MEDFKGAIKKKEMVVLENSSRRHAKSVIFPDSPGYERAAP